MYYHQTHFSGQTTDLGLWLDRLDQLWLNTLTGPAQAESTNYGTSGGWIHWWDQLWLDSLIGPPVAGSIKETSSGWIY